RLVRTIAARKRTNRLGDVQGLVVVRPRASPRPHGARELAIEGRGSPRRPSRRPNLRAHAIAGQARPVVANDRTLPEANFDSQTRGRIEGGCSGDETRPPLTARDTQAPSTSAIV